jgi:hypothetical protein
MSKEKFGFVYLWFDRKHKRYYVGCHWGTFDDGYICSSRWMKKSYKRRPGDFKRKILKTNLERTQMYVEEQRYLDMIKPEEIKIRYYNISRFSKKPWHQYPDSVKTIGQKISYSKKGKSTGSRDPSIGKKISETKKKKLAEKGGFTEEHKEKLRQAKLGKKHTEEWKQQNSERMKTQWSDGTRKRAESKTTMTREEQNNLTLVQLKNRWADPVWAENQRKKLSEGAKKRPPRSEESKLKARMAQLGKPKVHKIINISKEPNQTAVL